VTNLIDVAVLPIAEDNAAVAFVELEPGTSITLPDGATFTVRHRVPVGHRFLVRDLAADAPVLSWGASFGRALADLPAGSYICTARSLAALLERGITDLPAAATVRDEEWRRYTAEDGYSVGEQIAPVADPRTFDGFARDGGRYGTRNYVAVVGLTAREGAFAEEVARRSQHLVGEPGSDGLDGVVPVAHTEGDAGTTPNNLDLLLRTLVGMIDNPNLGAVVLVERPHATVTVEVLQQYAHDHGLAWGRVPYEVVTRRHSFDTDATAAAAAVERLVPGVRAQQRVPAPLSALAIGLQCGGSDAFSGVSANPLSGAAAREVVRHGGTAVLAETDELIGAEGYILSNVAGPEVADRFMHAVETFTDRVGWHGHSAEGNPSGGNILRGLHNIVLKSLGAARKKDPALRLDGVIDYAEPVAPKGFLFMDSPGNDLESVAGQVGSGCNMIYFTTGNGSITNFPFVPTVKFVTTTQRFELLHQDMDVNAGRHLDGEPFDALTGEVFDLTVDVASGLRTAGERAGHSQVQIWRDWAQDGPVTGPTTHPHGPALLRLGRPDGPTRDDLAPLTDHVRDGVPLPAPPAVADAVPLEPLGRVVRADGRTASETVALVLPTSLCSGQIAARIADRATGENWHGGRADRAVALPHTEGCGSSSGDSEEIYTRTMINHLRHPNTGWALLLEHGCEKTHNDHFRGLLAEAGIDPSTVGYASIQADGGIGAATQKVKDWFDDRVAESPVPQRRSGDWTGVVVGVCGVGAGPEGIAPVVADALAAHAVRVLASGGSVVLSTDDPLLRTEAFRALVDPAATPTLGHGQRIETDGLHLMNAAGADRLETLTGLGGTGAEVALAASPGPGQRYVPVLRVAAAGAPGADDADLVLDGPDGSGALVRAVAEVLEGSRTVTAHRDGDEGFQFTRGLLGVSL